MSVTVIKGGVVVNEGVTRRADVIITDGCITEIVDGGVPGDVRGAETIDAVGCCVLPGVIDSHVHFREPGMTERGDMSTESAAAAAGGVTTIFDMPNTVPPTTTIDALEEKFAIAATKCHVNYSFFFGATNDNSPLFAQLDPHRIPGIKVFMGSSTGDMLVDSREALGRVFSAARLPIVAHCEDMTIINRNMTRAKAHDDAFPDVALHPLIRSAEACCRSTSLAVAMARAHGARLHVAHLSTARETGFFSPDDEMITAEVAVGHLLFSDADYKTCGTMIKVNPAIKTAADRDALRRAIADGRITTVATDHAPHLLRQKRGGCDSAASGMPMVQYSLPVMLGLVDEGVLPVERVVALMCHNPARVFGVRRRGYLRRGYMADVTIVRRGAPWTVRRGDIRSKCGWSPVEGRTFRWRVVCTICNGRVVYRDGAVDERCVGQAVAFR